jgi:hypothetical protein
LEIIPVIVTYWRLEQLLWERLVALRAEALLRRLQIDVAVAALGATVSAAFGAARLYLPLPTHALILGEILAGLVFLGGLAAYLRHRPAARRAVWPV